MHRSEKWVRELVLRSLVCTHKDRSVFFFPESSWYVDGRIHAGLGSHMRCSAGVSIEYGFSRAGLRSSFFIWRNYFRRDVYKPPRLAATADTVFCVSPNHPQAELGNYIDPALEQLTVISEGMKAPHNADSYVGPTNQQKGKTFSAGLFTAGVSDTCSVAEGDLRVEGKGRGMERDIVVVAPGSVNDGVSVVAFGDDDDNHGDSAIVRNKKEEEDGVLDTLLGLTVAGSEPSWKPGKGVDVTVARMEDETVLVHGSDGIGTAASIDRVDSNVALAAGIRGNGVHSYGGGVSQWQNEKASSPPPRQTAAAGRLPAVAVINSSTHAGDNGQREARGVPESLRNADKTNACFGAMSADVVSGGGGAADELEDWLDKMLGES